MKKLKIFLLLSILLCFGFVLSSEVHAQGDGPREFKVEDILPATTQLRISWPGILDEFSFGVLTDNSNFSLVYAGTMNGLPHFFVNGIPIYNASHKTWISPYNNTDHAYIDIDTSTWDESKRTISYYNHRVNEKLFWEDLNATSNAKPCDFYNNFDKYFIPAMIIVFGGAIVLTILKVFKGRE